MFKVKSSVQALDPVCGIWLSATILELEEDRAKVKWLGYPKSAASFLNFSKVRSPVLKRQYRPRKEDWPRREPRNLQKGDVVYYKMPDGSSTIVTIDENDPWNCWIKANDRTLLYEHVKDLSEDFATTTAALEDKENVPPTDTVTGQKQAVKTTRTNPQQADGPSQRQNPLGTQKQTTQKKKTDKGNSIMSSRRGSPLNQKRSPEEAPKTVVAKKTKVVKEGGSTMSGRRGTLTKGPAEASKTVAKTKKVTKERATTIALEPAVKIIAMEGAEDYGTAKDLGSLPLPTLLQYGLDALEAMEDDSPRSPSPPPSFRSPSPPPSPPRDATSQTDTQTDSCTMQELQRQLEVLKASLAELAAKQAKHEKNCHCNHTESLPITVPRLSSANEVPVQSPEFPSPPTQTVERTPLRLLTIPDTLPPAAREVQLPTLTTPSTRTVDKDEAPTETNHDAPLRLILKELLGPQVIFHGKPCYSANATLVNQVIRHAAHPPSLAREVLRKIFTPHELAVSNVRGFKKKALDPVRVHTVFHLVAMMCNIPSIVMGHTWTVCVRAMDQAMRNERKSRARLLSL